MKTVEIENRPPQTLRLVEGEWGVGRRVTVEIDGKRVTRTVFWDGQAKDIAVRYKGGSYGLAEFENQAADYFPAVAPSDFHRNGDLMPCPQCGGAPRRRNGAVYCPNCNPRKRGRN